MRTVRRTGRWRGIVAVALFTAALGVLVKRPSVLLLGIVGVGYAVYPQLSGPPTVDLELDRRVSEPRPERGDAVNVTTRVTNVGASTLTDVRILDGVPPMLTVESGSPRYGAVLRPGSTAEFTYAVDAQHGRHTFEPATVIARDVTGAHEVETTVETETEIEVAEEVPEVPLRPQTDGHVGRLVTDEGGSGLEFHAVREYRPGDPMSRIDWKRRARTGELTTVEFREERATSVVLLVDARPPAYRSRADGEPNAVAHGLAGVERLLAALESERDFVGLAAFGREFCWLDPGSGPEHRHRARRLLDAHPAFSAVPPRGEVPEAPDQQATELTKRLGRDTQVVAFSPLADRFVARTLLSLEAAGNAVTVVSPDVTADVTVGTRLARAERDNRAHALRQAGVPVIDWDPDEPLGTTLVRGTERRWSA